MGDGDVERVGRRTEDGGQPEQKTENRKQSAQFTFFRSADILVRLCVRLFILVSALVLTDAQGRKRMSALQSHPVDDAGKN